MHDEIQEMIQRLTGKMNLELTQNLLGGYVKRMQKRITLPNAGGGTRFRPSPSPFLGISYDEERAPKPAFNVVDASGSPQQISVNIVEINKEER